MKAASLLFVGALLLAAVPLASAADGLSVSKVTDDIFDLSLQNGREGVTTTEYRLDLDRDMRVAFSSQLQGDASIAAEWRLDGAVIGSSTDGEGFEADLSAGDDQGLDVVWSVPSDLTEGPHDLLIQLYEVNDPEGQGANPVQGVVVRLTMDLDRFTPASGGGGGGAPPADDSGDEDDEGSEGQGSTEDPDPEESDDNTENTPPADQDDAPQDDHRPDTVPPMDRDLPRGEEHRASLDLEGEALEALRAAGLDVQAGDIRLEDLDSDGRYDTLSDDRGRLETVHAMPARGLLLVQDVAYPSTRVIVDAVGGLAAPVQALDGHVQGSRVVDDEGTETMETEVRVDKVDGWIQVTVPDLYPDRPIQELRRGDDPIGADLAWRADGQIHFLDDPETTYTLAFGEPDADVHATDDAGDGGWTVVPWIVLGLVVGAALTALGVVLMRRRD